MYFTILWKNTKFHSRVKHATNNQSNFYIMNLKFYSLSLGALVLASMASCSNDVNDTPNKGEKLPAMQLAQAPDLVIWNAAEVFAGEAPSVANTKATTKYQNDEVEVNLAIQDIHEKYDIEDLVSHLSIHVRSITDVTVVLPVDKKWYCDQDDLYIYEERDIDDWTLEESENTLTATIGEGDDAKEVTLKVVFNDENITITTKGIDRDVMAAVTDVNGDIIGINFDVYNYFNRGNQYTTGSYAAWTLEGMKEALDESTVTFTETPDYYINAFTRLADRTPSWVMGKENKKVLRDCKVTPEEGIFFGPFNGSTNADAYNFYNRVYMNKLTFPNADTSIVYDAPEAPESDED